MLSKERPLPKGADLSRQLATDSIWVDHVLEEKEPLKITKRYNIADKLPKDAQNSSERPFHAGANVYNTTAVATSALVTTIDESPESSLESSQSDDLTTVTTSKSRASPKSTAPVSGLHARAKSTSSAKKSAPATPKTPATTPAARTAKAASAAKGSKAKASAAKDLEDSDDIVSVDALQDTAAKNDKKRKRGEDSAEEAEAAANKIGTPSKRKSVAPKPAPLSTATPSTPTTRAKTPKATSAAKGKKAAASTENGASTPKTPGRKAKAVAVEVMEIDDSEDGNAEALKAGLIDDISEEIAAITAAKVRTPASAFNPRKRTASVAESGSGEPQTPKRAGKSKRDEDSDAELDISEELAHRPPLTPSRPQRTHTSRLPLIDPHAAVNGAEAEQPKQRKKPLVGAAPSSGPRPPRPPRYVPPKYEHRIYLSGYSDLKKADLSFRLQQLAIDHNVSMGLVDTVGDATIFVPQKTPSKNSPASINMLMAIMRGIWLLEASWLDSLLKHGGKIPKREKYEITTIPGPRKARLARKERKDYLASLDEEARRASSDDNDSELPRLIFSDWAFNLDSWRSNNPTVEQLAFIIEYGAGIITNNPWDADVWFTSATTPTPEPRYSTDTPMSSEDARTLKSMPLLRKRAFTAPSTKRGMPTYGFHLEWLRDSILAYDAQPPKKYENMIKIFSALS